MLPMGIRAKIPCNLTNFPTHTNPHKQSQTPLGQLCDVRPRRRRLRLHANQFGAQLVPQVRFVRPAISRRRAAIYSRKHPFYRWGIFVEGGAPLPPLTCLPPLFGRSPGHSRPQNSQLQGGSNTGTVLGTIVLLPLVGRSGTGLAS